MNSRSSFVIGLLAGVLLCFFFLRERKAPPQPTAPIGEAVPVQKIVKPVQKIETTIAPAPPAVEKKEHVSFEPTPASEPVSKAKVKRLFELSLSPETIDAMERDWDNLPAQIEIQSEARGWRVVRVSSSSYFGMMGLQEGDFITRESLARLSVSDEDLSRRFENILNHTSR